MISYEEHLPPRVTAQELTAQLIEVIESGQPAFYNIVAPIQSGKSRALTRQIVPQVNRVFQPMVVRVSNLEQPRAEETLKSLLKDRAAPMVVLDNINTPEMDFYRSIEDSFMLPMVRAGRQVVLVSRSPLWFRHHELREATNSQIMSLETTDAPVRYKRRLEDRAFSELQSLQPDILPKNKQMEFLRRIVDSFDAGRQFATQGVIEGQTLTAYIVHGLVYQVGSMRKGIYFRPDDTIRKIFD
jgi:hypothetical protein